jgi:hypothetical protein
MSAQVCGCRALRNLEQDRVAEGLFPVHSATVAAAVCGGVARLCHSRAAGGRPTHGQTAACSRCARATASSLE